MPSATCLFGFAEAGQPAFLGQHPEAIHRLQRHQNGCYQVAKEFARLEQDTCQDYRRCDHYHIECVSEDNGVSPQYDQHWAR